MRAGFALLYRRGLRIGAKLAGSGGQESMTLIKAASHLENMSVLRQARLLDPARRDNPEAARRFLHDWHRPQGSLDSRTVDRQTCPFEGQFDEAPVRRGRKS